MYDEPPPSDEDLADEASEEDLGDEPSELPRIDRPSLWERLRRRPFGFGFWAGVAILVFYFAAGISALVVFRGTLDQLAINPTWAVAPPYQSPTPPSWQYPFGVLPGLGVDLFRALWQATPWDLAIVAGILAFDVAIGCLVGVIAGMNEGGALDAVLSWVTDTIGAIPSFFLVIGIFAAVTTLAPGDIGIPLFIVVFGFVIWPATARLTRDRARIVARQPYVEATRASGGGRRRILFRHILPGSVSAVLAQLPLDVAPIFFVLIVFPWFWNTVSPPPGAKYGVADTTPTLPPFSPLPNVNFPEWGYLLAVGMGYGLPISEGLVGVPVYWWMFLFPLAAILGLAFGIALVCDGLDRRLATRRR